ncbi:hypothetical protein tpqmel_0531 [Candidatus Gastranaerophilus sp. (ex Termes propinquus)]|nr:hypothetical protein tpqmel_0523 [Candidatus Gastranaerophilus sp. (ex Termes propinquus)]GBF23127.1 hypothetical protein tpqmel_0531 [Candidatus Gastranaerophilus sp. (ex Termes propinquus)]
MAMEEDNYKIEALKNLRNEMTHVWGSAFVLGGGGVTLVILRSSTIEAVLGWLAFLGFIIFMNAYFSKYIKVDKITEELRRKK